MIIVATWTSQGFLYHVSFYRGETISVQGITISTQVKMFSPRYKPFHPGENVFTRMETKGKVTKLQKNVKCRIWATVLGYYPTYLGLLVSLTLAPELLDFTVSFRNYNRSRFHPNLSFCPSNL